MTEKLENATEPEDVAAALGAAGVSVADVDAIAGVGSERWDRARLLELRDLVLMLSESLTPTGIGPWLGSPNRLLEGRRPVDVAAGGGPVAGYRGGSVVRRRQLRLTVSS